MDHPSKHPTITLTFPSAILDNALRRALEEREIGGLLAPELRPALLSRSEVAQTLRVSMRSLDRLRESGQFIEPLYLGAYPRWRRSDVETWIAEASTQRDEG
ncbi:helix-turn-helix domain-containing protein [Engelhardtia mirabilis]|uniref:helix-turn-helix transcriptional regulator n=1 Tax=Engelhardtia mirabilis TaxID=2528011 RepID=UPI00119D4622